MINEIVTAIEKIKSKKGSCIVAVDGRCGSGKTTVAKKLGEILDASVICMDDFFLPPYKRDENWLSEIGGNIDCDRFLKEVLLPLNKGQDCSYKPFLCQAASFGEEIKVKKTSVCIVEGSYSCMEKFFNSYDLHIFIDTDKATQLKRLEEREGEERLKAFNEKWIPLEERYFTVTDIKYKCEIYYKT